MSSNKGLNVLITGGAGYIGTELVHRLASNDRVKSIVIYDNLSRRNYNLFLEGRLPSDKVRFVEAELLDTRRLKTHLEGVDVVFHLAAVVSTPYSNENPHLFEQVNHWGTAELGYMLEESAVRRVIYASSTSVYGLHSQDSDRAMEFVSSSGKGSDDDDRSGDGREYVERLAGAGSAGGGSGGMVSLNPKPSSHYGISKHAGERMLTRLSNRMEVIVLRCANVFGYSRSMRFDSVINRFMFYAHHQGRISIFGDGSQKRPFVSIGRVIDVMESAGLAVNTPLKPGIYDLVEWNLSVQEIANLVKDLYVGLEILHISPDMRLGGLTVSPDPSLIDLSTQKPITRILQEFHDGFSLGESKVDGVIRV